jgi:hypothetical protein
MDGGGLQVKATPQTPIDNSGGSKREVFGYLDMMTADGKVQKTYMIDQTCVTLGRDHKANIRFTEGKLSRNQCEILVKPASKGQKAQVYNQSFHFCMLLRSGNPWVSIGLGLLFCYYLLHRERVHAPKAPQC